MIFNVFKHWKLIGEAFSNSFNIIGFKINNIFSKPLNIIFGLLFAFIAFAAFITPPYIVSVASRLMSNNSDLYKEFISGTFVLVAANDGLDAVNLWLTGLLGTIFIAPIVSNTLASSYSKNLLFGVRRKMSYQIADSVVLQFMSPLIITALVYTLFFASLLRYEYSLPAFLTVIMVLVWVLSVFLFTFIGWVNELFSRKYGVKYKIFYVVFFAGAIFFNYFVADNINLFGFSNIMTEFIKNASAEYNSVIFIIFGFLTVSLFLMFYLFQIGLITLHKYPAPFKEKKYVSETRSLLPTVVKILFRFDSIKVPILFMLAVLTIVFWFQNDETSRTIFGLSFILPLIFSLTLFINIFGLVNSGNSWLASSPKFRNRVLYAAIALNVCFVILGSALITLPSFLMGNISLTTWSKFIILNIFATILTFFVSINHSVKKPSRYDFHVRGENIVPPGGALRLTGLMLLVSGLPTLLIGSLLPPLQIIVLTSILIIFLIFSVERKNFYLSQYGMNHVASLTG